MEKVAYCMWSYFSVKLLFNLQYPTCLMISSIPPHLEVN